MEVNTAFDSASPGNAIAPIDFTQLPGGKLNVPSGPPPSVGAAAPTVALDFAGPFLKVSGFVSLSIGDFVHVSGGFSVEPGKETTVTLQDPDGGGQQSAQTRTVTLMKIGVSHGRLFVGVGGPYWQDSNNNGGFDAADQPAAAGAMGVVMEDVAFALALLKTVQVNGQPIEESFYALKASGGVRFVGIDGFDIRAKQMDIEVNGSRGPPGVTVPVVDFAASFTNPDQTKGLRISTGSSPSDFILLDFASPFLRVRGLATIRVSEFIHVSGSFDIQPGQELNTTLTDNTSQRVTALQIGAGQVRAFVGIGGPYCRIATTTRRSMTTI